MYQLAALAALASLSAMSGPVERIYHVDRGDRLPRKKPRPRSYSKPCGPPYPETRQQRRAMMREREKALSAIARTTPERKQKP